MKDRRESKKVKRKDWGGGQKRKKKSTWALVGYGEQSRWRANAQEYAKEEIEDNADARSKKEILVHLLHKKDNKFFTFQLNDSCNAMSYIYTPLISNPQAIWH